MAEQKVQLRVGWQLDNEQTEDIRYVDVEEIHFWKDSSGDMWLWVSVIKEKKIKTLLLKTLKWFFVDEVKFQRVID